MVVNIYNTAFKHRNAKDPGYRVLKTGSGFLVEYKHSRVDDIMYIPASSLEGCRGIINNLDRPQYLDFLYRNRHKLTLNSRVRMARASRKPSPAQREAGAKKNATVFKKYLHAKGKNRVKDWYKFALSKKHIPITTNDKDHGIGMGFGPMVEGGKKYYTSFIVPVGDKVEGGEIAVTDVLNIYNSCGLKEYKAATSKLGKHSKLWAKLLKQVKVKAKSKSRIMDGSLARDLYRESAAA